MFDTFFSYKISVLIVQQQGVLIQILLPRIVFFITHSACRWGHPDSESGDVIEADVPSHGVHCFSTLYSQ
jgi:hypothetical protein